MSDGLLQTRLRRVFGALKKQPRREADVSHPSSLAQRQAKRLQADALSIRPTDRAFESTSVDATPAFLVSDVCFFFAAAAFFSSPETRH